MTEQKNKIRRYIPVADWSEHYDWPSVSALRFYIFNADKNGFNRVIRRVGRRVLISPTLFFQWVDEQGAEVKS